MSGSRDRALPVAIVGGGPVGLAAAAHLIERGLEPLVIEAGDEPAAAVARWGHVQLFTPWRVNVDAASERLLRAKGWRLPPADEYPTAASLREEYLLPLARVPEIQSRLQLRTRVVAISRRGSDKARETGRIRAPFELLVEHGGDRTRRLAQAVIDASGTFETPNPLGASGLPALGENRLGDRIAYGIPRVLNGQRARYAGKRVLVVGSGHSAMNVIDELVALRESEPRTHILWAIRGAGIKDGQTANALVERGRLTARAMAHVASGEVELVPHAGVEELSAEAGGVSVVTADAVLGRFDAIIAATGFRPDLGLTRELRLDLDPALEAPRTLSPLIDPRVHSCGTVPPHGAPELAQPEPDFYIAGMKSYGRAPTFLMLTGYEQVRSIAAALGGDQAAATRVELVLHDAALREGDACGSAACGSSVTDRCSPAPAVNALNGGERDRDAGSEC